MSPPAFQYLGAFRVTSAAGPADKRPQAYPPEWVERDSFGLGGMIAFDDVLQCLVMGTRRSRVAWLSMPAPVIASNIKELPTAERTTTYFDPSEDKWNEIGENATLAGMLSSERDWIVSGGIYYDANNTQRVGHKRNASPWRTVGNPQQQGLIAGYMAHVPEKWQAALKGRVCGGSASRPIISAGSMGPSAWSFNPDDLATLQDVPATFLVGYPSGHPTLGQFNATSPLYGISTQVSGMVMVDDWMIFAGSNGMGSACYGNGTPDASLHDTIGADGERWCYDPTSSAKAQHSYPYRSQWWIYSLSDLADVAAGTREPWSLIPEVLPLELPWPTPHKRIAGLAYDPTSRTIYVSQYEGDSASGLEPTPLVHAFTIAAPAVPTTTTNTDAQVQALAARIEILEAAQKRLIDAIKTALGIK